MVTAPRLDRLFGTLALVAVLCLPCPAAALVGDRYGAFGLDGSVRLLSLATQNYDAPQIFGVSNEADGLAQGIMRLVAGGHPLEELSYEAHLVQTTTLEAFSGPAALLGGAGGAGALFGPGASAGRYRLVPGQLAFGEERTGDVHAQLTVDRLNLKLITRFADITIGRQAVTFGTAYFWNPLDVFFAFGSTQFDRDYKPGVDAMRVDMPFGDFSGATVLVALGDADSEDLWRESAVVARAFSNFADWDLAVQGGKLRGGIQAGAAFAGEAFTVEMRGEAAYFWADDEAPLGDYFAAVLGVGRRFENTLHLQLEHLYNGGSADTLPESFLLVADGWLVQASENVTGLSITYELLPVLFGSLAYLFEWDNQSMLFQPGLVYSAAEEVDLVAGAVIAVGDRPQILSIESELGSYPNFFYVEAKVYF
jgi:hypothetical protein